MIYVVRWETTVEAPSHKEAAILATTQPRIFMEVREETEQIFISVDLTEQSS